MRKGFTLIELMIVVAIIAIIAAIAIPSLMRSRMAANETAAATSCKACAEAQEIFHRTDWDNDGVLEYSLGAVLDPAGSPGLYGNNGTPGLIDVAFANAFGANDGAAATGAVPPKSGYEFCILTTHDLGSAGAIAWTTTDAAGNTNLTLGYGVSAAPSSYDTTGRNNFMISNTGTIYQGDGNVTPSVHATVFDPGIQGGAAGALGIVWIPTE